MDFFEKFDRQKLQRITLIVIAALTLLALVLLLVIIIASVEDNGSIFNPGGDKNALFDTSKIDFAETEVTSAQLQTGSLILANSSHSYTAPGNLNLVNIAEYRNGKGHSKENFLYSVGDITNFKMEASAMEQAHNMLVALRDETKNDSIQIAGAYGKVEDGQKTDIYTGYTMALNVAGAAKTELSDESNKELNDWLLKNAHKYGFVVRYPADKADLTGVSDYTYAFRYVGIPHAYYMKEQNLCLEEYLEILQKDFNSTKKALEISADGKKYGVYYLSCEENDKIRVPDEDSKYSYTVSGTNDGGVVVTIVKD